MMADLAFAALVLVCLLLPVATMIGFSINAGLSVWP
jgi:hypothetical protein